MTYRYNGAISKERRFYVKGISVKQVDVTSFNYSDGLRDSKQKHTHGPMYLDQYILFSVKGHKE